MLGDTDWAKALTDLATVGANTAVALKTKTPLPTTMRPPTSPTPSSSNRTMGWVVGGIAVIGLGIVAISILKKRKKK